MLGIILAVLSVGVTVARISKREVQRASATLTRARRAYRAGHMPQEVWEVAQHEAAVFTKRHRTVKAVLGLSASMFGSYGIAHVLARYAPLPYSAAWQVVGPPLLSAAVGGPAGIVASVFLPAIAVAGAATGFVGYWRDMVAARIPALGRVSGGDAWSIFGNVGW